ncbi:sensor histidine kinase [Gordonia pseudamarae]|jgi:signal transduction histidine kinase|uniref:histidine kinase n=1 Tax=Gordonia pseudamarae TaxID=2831662 RepID=A0ABX6IKT3_9ACTN|nr:MULTISPECIES: histidine kinase [Gordonia]MBD0024180.1 sensor histidine kinase [Gordonia sp. (in: high G+C Gram-positive bacteria)]QHN27026.1 sensor histidine kinase [Gordonia pseudamarae]QHN35915.1 sensor histidine kinase [Gordonia pseudamarae]
MQGKFVDGIRSVGTVLVREVADHPAMTDPAVRRYFSSKVNWLFLMVALIMYAVAWPTLTLTHDLPAYWLPIVSAFAALPIALSWSAPSVGWAVSVLSAYLVALLVPVDPGWNWEIQVVHIIELLVLTFFVFARGPLRSLPLVWICTVVIFVLVAPAEARVGWAVGLTFLAVVTALVRGLLRVSTQLRASTEETELAESRKVVLEERARIARDLHDVVAHRMSVVVVMAQTARYRLDDVGDDAVAEFDAIADAARASLDEVRQMLGVLRLDDGSGSYLAAPNPGLGDIAELVAQTGRTGVDVLLDDTADRETVGDASALVIYRIVQESLANATRHAPGAAISVRLSPARGEATDVVITNGPARGEPLRLAGAGTGLAGMAERARIVGGSVSAGERDGGGFEVRAQIPDGPWAATGVAGR